MNLTGKQIKVLLLLNDKGPSYGYGLCKEINVLLGTIYKVTGQLEQKGLIQSYWEEKKANIGARRKWYKITNEGKKALSEFR